MAKVQHELNWESREDCDVRDILKAWEHARREKARAEMKAQQRVLGERRFLQAGDIGGEVGLMIHPEVFHYWGQRLGYGCWNDKQFVHEFLRDNPEARVKNRNPNPTVAVAGLSTVGNKRFTKSYGNN